MSKTTAITVAYGDGIGPEIMEATLKILKYAKANITIETIEVGEQVYKKGFSSGIPNSAWETIRQNKILLKSPITTPQGGGYKSLNVTMRKALGLYANVRPCVAFHPFVKTNHPNLNVVIVRENEEDIYAGIEYRPTHNNYESMKLITRTGSERIIRYAFEYAVKNGRSKVTCMSKDNIMKFSDGIFHKVFDEVAKEYPKIENNHMIIDIGSAKLANKPEIFDVIVTSNLYGDIISDIVAEVSGSVGLAGSANIGQEFAMFEAIHGSAPDIAGQQIANPSGLLQGAIMMLIHIGQPEVAEHIHNAWLKTIEDGMHTADIYDPELSHKKVTTNEFADEVIKRLGKKPAKFATVHYKKAVHEDKKDVVMLQPDKKEVKKLVGADIFVDWYEGNAADLAEKILKAVHGKLKLQMISCKGLKIWPQSDSLDLRDDLWRLRFAVEGDKLTNFEEIQKLMDELVKAKFDIVKMLSLYSYDDKPGFSLSQGE